MKTDIVKLSLNDLPKYTSWLPYLLGIESFSRSLKKTPESIQREYGVEKWGKLLQYLKESGLSSLQEADDFFIKDTGQPFFQEDSLNYASSKLVHELYFQIIAATMLPLLRDSKYMVELGAGYGSIILKLADLPELSHVTFGAGEYTQSGLDCIKLLDTHSGRISLGSCDLTNLNLGELAPPENAIYMTSWTMACLSGFSRDTLNELLSKKPKMVVHFEPIFEHWDDDSLLSLLWKRYLQINNYNTTMLSALKSYEQEGLIKVTEEKKSIFGSNPLAPVSIIKWIPCT